MNNTVLVAPPSPWSTVSPLIISSLIRIPHWTMSQNAAISSLEGLELEPSLITLLKNIGIETVSDLAISVPQDLFEQCGLTDERLALDLVMKAKNLSDMFFTNPAYTR